jgi:prefoldin beta subunit
MNNEIQEQVNNLSMLEQNMQQLAAQRQSFQAQLIEIDSALEEIKDSKETFRIIGSIMVKVEPSKLKEDLNSKKQLLDIRIKSIEKQEDAIKEKSKKLQDEILLKIEGEKNSSNNALGDAPRQKKKASKNIDDI